MLCIGTPVVACVGDCNGDGMVSVDEMVEGVRISLGEAPLSQCPAFDANGKRIKRRNPSGSLARAWKWKPQIVLKRP